MGIRKVSQSIHSTYLIGCNNTGAVGTDQSGFALSLESVFHPDHVLLGNALGDAHNKWDLRFNGFHDGGGSARRGNVNDGAVGFHRGGGLD